MGLALFLCSFYLWNFALSYEIYENAVARQPGDIMIGGIFPIHKGVSNLLERTNAEDFKCTRLQLHVLIDALSMIYSIEKINNSTLLPGITLGYEIYDSCSDALKAIKATLHLIPDSFTKNNSTYCNSTINIPAIKAVVGEKYSEISIAVSRILSLHLIPQISPASSAATLSDKVRFPSFLRTIPNDNHQTQAIAKLIRVLQWNWVGIITNDDDYGRSALDSLNIYFKEEGICTAFSKIIPSYVEHPNMTFAINDTTNELVAERSPEVVVVFLKGPIVSQLFEKVIGMNISKTWIASDSWSYSKEVSSIVNIQNVGTIFGLNFKAGNVQGFAEYLQNLQPPGDGGINTFLEEYKELRFGCTEEYLMCMNSSSKDCLHIDSLQHKSPQTCKVENVSYANDNYLLKNIEWNKAYSTSLAVTAIAQALKNILCTKDKCVDYLNLSPHKLLNELKKGNYSYNNETFHFDPSGDVLTGYDIISWNPSNKKETEFQIVGKYDMSDGIINLNRSLLFWNNPNNQVPFSNCSKPCIPGYYKKHSDISCCYKCIPCAEQYYTPEADMNECLKCPNTQWSNNGSFQCLNRTLEYFQWNDPFAIALMSFTALGFLLVIVIGILFIKYSDTPTVKAAGGNYTYLLVVSLLLNLVSIWFFIGQPKDLICQVRQPLYGISFTVSVLCILIKAIRILLAFESAKRNKAIITLTYQPVAIIITLTCVQLCICIFWFIFKRPFVKEIDTLPKLLILQCDEGSYVAFSIMLGYIGFLAFICFILAYKGRKLPEKYNEARCITFSMLIYIFVWIIFIPIYMNASSLYLAAVQAVAILASIYGVISCHLIPACYIITFKRKSNNRDRYLQSVCAFYKGKRRVLSLYQNKYSIKSPRTDSITGTEVTVSTEQKPTFLGTTFIVRKRHKSC